MKDSVWKRISAKRPKGKSLILLIGLGSGAIWILSLAAVLFVKGKADAKANDKGAKTAAALKHKGAEAAAEESSGTGDNAGKVADENDEDENSDAKTDEDDSGDDDGSATEVADGKDGGEKAASADKAEAGAIDRADAEGAKAEGEGSRRAAKRASDESLPTHEELAALRQLAELYVGSGEPAKAVTPMRRVMQMPTREVKLLRMAVDVFLGTGNYREALDNAEQVLALEPDNMDVKVQAVEARYRMGRVDKAIAEAQAALKAHAGHLGMLTELATIEIEQGPGFADYGKSLAAALKLKADYAPALYLAGRKAQLEGDYHDAETAFRKVVKLEPRNAKAHGQLGMAFYLQGKEKDAEKEYRAELDMNPEDYNTWFNLGEIQLARADRETRPAEIQSWRTQAMECYLKALALNPDHAEAHYRVGVLLNGNGEYKEAIRHLEAALRLDDRHVPTLVQLCVAYENLKQPERARAYLTKAYELDPLNKVVLFKLKQWS